MSRQPPSGLGADASSRASCESAGAGRAPAWVLTYHEVEPTSSNYLYAVTAQQLDEQLRVVAERRRRSGAGVPAIEVTFDDGHLSNFSVARPLLQQHGISATFFVTAGRIGKSTQAMTWSQLGTLLAEGHKVQSHGWSHKFLTRCSPNELEDELRRPKNELEQRLGQAVDSVSAPGGRWNARVLQRAAEAGYLHFYLSDPWHKAKRKAGVNVFGRLMIRNTMALSQFEHWLDLDAGDLGWRRLEGRMKNAVRAMLGDELYHRVWCALAVRSKPSKAEGG